MNVVICDSNGHVIVCSLVYIYVVGSKSFRSDIHKPCLMDKEAEYLVKGTELMVHRCEKCVVIKGDCIEK